MEFVQVHVRTNLSDPFPKKIVRERLREHPPSTGSDCVRFAQRYSTHIRKPNAAMTRPNMEKFRAVRQKWVGSHF